MGIFHPHSQHHNIKKENIGLIEVMGLAVLPGRLKFEMRKIAEYLKDEDFEKQFEIARQPKLLRFLALNTTLYGENCHEAHREFVQKINPF